MSNEEIIAGNKLIAEFMGIQWRMLDHRLLLSSDKGESWYGKLYDKDWGALMPVVEKISKLPIMDSSGDTHFPVTFGMLSSETGNPMFRFYCMGLFEAPTLIEAVWLAVVDFIQSTNTQQH